MSGLSPKTALKASGLPEKNGVSTSIKMFCMLSLKALIVKTNCAAPPSLRSSLVTEVITTCFSFSSFAAMAMDNGSSRDGGAGLRFFPTLQKPQFLVHTSPSIRNVAVGFEKHSPIFGHRALSHTV